MSYPNTSPTSCHLFRIINTVKNNASFVERICTLWILPRSQYFLTSYLFTCIPPHLAIEDVKERLDSDQTLLERTNLSIQNIMTLLQFVRDDNFFVLQGSHFHQICGCPTRSPVSAILANLVVEPRCGAFLPPPPKYLFSYCQNFHQRANQTRTCEKSLCEMWAGLVTREPQTRGGEGGETPRCTTGSQTCK